MSREYIALIVDAPDDASEAELEGSKVEIFMRFTEHPGDAFLQRLAASYPGKRVYCLMGASSWYSVAASEK